MAKKTATLTEDEARFDDAINYVNGRAVGIGEANMRTKMRQVGIPEYMVDGLMLYLTEGYTSGSFLMAVLTNDLRMAVSCGDGENQKALAGYVIFLYNNAPAVAWGSVENVQGYMAAGERRRERNQ